MLNKLKKTEDSHPTLGQPVEHAF